MYRSVAINQSHGFAISFKRAMFMTGLYFRLIKNYNPDDSILAEFNKMFYLANDPTTLSFPAMAARFLWRGHKIDPIVRYCDDGDYKHAVEQVHATMPNWLRYIDRETIMRDVDRVLRQALPR